MITAGMLYTHWENISSYDTDQLESEENNTYKHIFPVFNSRNSFYSFNSEASASVLLKLENKCFSGWTCFLKINNKVKYYSWQLETYSL